MLWTLYFISLLIFNGKHGLYEMVLYFRSFSVKLFYKKIFIYENIVSAFQKLQRPVWNSRLNCKVVVSYVSLLSHTYFNLWKKRLKVAILLNTVQCFFLPTRKRHVTHFKNGNCDTTSIAELQFSFVFFVRYQLILECEDIVSRSRIYLHIKILIDVACSWI